MYYFWTETEDCLTFDTLEAAFKAAAEHGLLKVRDNQGGEYFV